MFYYLLVTITVLFFLAGIIALTLRWRGVRFFKSREQVETEEGLRKTFGEDTKWGFSGSAETEIREHTDYGHSSDGGGGHDGGGGGDGGGGSD